MTCAQGLLRLLWGGARSWSATGLHMSIMSAYCGVWEICGWLACEVLAWIRGSCERWKDKK